MKSHIVRRTIRPTPTVRSILCGVALMLIASAPSTTPLEGVPLLQALNGGGLNLYFRHAATDWSQDDFVEARDDWLSCDGNKIRQLSDQGRATAQSVGAALRQLGVPVSEVIASPYCRTMETARLLGVGAVNPTDAVINMRVADYFGGREAVIRSAQRLLGSRPPLGGNRIIVAHGNVARDATPVYPGEAEAIVFRPLGEGRFEVVGRLSPQEWAALAAGI